DRHADPELFLIYQRTPLLDHALRFQPLNALPTRCGGEADQISDLGDRVRGVLLKEGENLTVDGVHSENSISADKCGSAAVGRIISSQLRSLQLYLENY